MPEINPFSGGKFESPVTHGDKGARVGDNQPDPSSGAQFDMRFKRDEKSSEKDGHKNG